MQANEATLLWNPGTDQVAVVRRPHGRRYAEYSHSGLGAYAELHRMSFEQRKAAVFIEALASTNLDLQRLDLLAYRDEPLRSAADLG